MSDCWPGAASDLLHRYCAGPGRLGYYNNWFVTRIDWWLEEPRVSRMIKAFDRSNLIFSRRLNDLIFQTAAIKLFLPLRKRKRYADFTYQHHTVDEGRVTCVAARKHFLLDGRIARNSTISSTPAEEPARRYGGIEIGALDPDGKGNLDQYVQQKIPKSQRKSIDVDTCLVQETRGGPLAEISYISPAKVRPTDMKRGVNIAQFESPHCSERDDRTSLLT